jgi:hypothetical protein
MPIENEIAQRQEAAKKAALPKSHRDDAFSGTLRGDPLQQESDPEDQATRQPDHLPSIHLYHQKRKRTQHGHFPLSHRTPTVARGRFQCGIVQQLTNLFGSGDCPVTPWFGKGLELRTELRGWSHRKLQSPENLALGYVPKVLRADYESRPPSVSRRHAFPSASPAANADPLERYLAL